MRRPPMGDFQIAVRTVLPFHITSRGSPTLTESRRAMAARPLFLLSSRVCLCTGLFIPSVERRQVPRIPCLAEPWAVQVPVRADFSSHGAQVVPKIDDRRTAPEPIAVVDTVNDEAWLEDERMWNHRVVFGFGVLPNVEVLLDDSIRIGEKWPLGSY